MQRHTTMQQLSSVSEIFNLLRKETKNKYKIQWTLKIISNELKLLHTIQIKEVGSEDVFNSGLFSRQTLAIRRERLIYRSLQNKPVTYKTQVSKT